MKIDNKGGVGERVTWALAIQFLLFSLVGTVLVWTTFPNWILGVVVYLTVFVASNYIWSLYHPTYKEWGKILLLAIGMLLVDGVIVILLAIFIAGLI